MKPNLNQDKKLNLVLGGGGMKGIGLIGAAAALEDAGYEFNVLAGSSAGSMVAALLASGMTRDQIRKIIEDLDFTSFLDSGFLSGRLGAAMQGLAVVTRASIHSGANLYKWVSDTLEAQGVRTFADLKLDVAKETPIEYRYKLVVTTADITNGRLLQLPWDYHLLGLDPDKQLVADAIRAATALPLIYEPYVIGGATLIDGGLLENFPTGIMRALLPFRDETVGVRLSFAPEVKSLHRDNSKRLNNLARAMIITMLNAQAEEMMRDPELRDNMIEVDVDDVKVTDFHIDKAKQQKLFQNGYDGAKAYLVKKQGNKS